MAKVSELSSICVNRDVNRDLCQIHLTKFHDFSVQNVTCLYWLAGIYERFGMLALGYFRGVVIIRENKTVNFM